MPTLTLLSEGHTIHGTVQAGEDIVIAGRLSGRLESDHSVTVDVGGFVEADVQARHLLVRGTVVGDVNVSELIEVEATGKLVGSVKTQKLKLAPGGLVSAKIETGISIATPRFSSRSTQKASWTPPTRTPASAPVERTPRRPEFVEIEQKTTPVVDTASQEVESGDKPSITQARPDPELAGKKNRPTPV